MNAPLPDYTAIVRMTSDDQMEALFFSLAHGWASALLRMVRAEANRRGRPAASDEATQWVDTLVAAKEAGLLDDVGEIKDDETRKLRIKRARGRIAQWSKGHKWASRPSGRGGKVLIDILGFRRHLNLRRSA